MMAEKGLVGRTAGPPDQGDIVHLDHHREHQVRSWPQISQ